MKKVLVIGGGLAGSEAALQLAKRGVSVQLWEMRPQHQTPAHHTDQFAELVCSNSLKSDDPKTAAGLLKVELHGMDSELLKIARATSVGAGAALAVDRSRFAAQVTLAVMNHPLIDVVNEEFTLDKNGDDLPVIIAAGPLASDALMRNIDSIIGSAQRSFYDAAAPVVLADSLDRDRVFYASRWGKGEETDYLNIALDESEYRDFYENLINAKRVIAKNFEKGELFSGCQPVEEVARTGFDALRYGALKPVGIDDPRTGRWPFALIQLRAEDQWKQSYNLVGFQTNLTFGEQKRVFSALPGLANADFVRYGVMHRNTFIESPRLLSKSLALRGEVNSLSYPIYFAGQIVGTEGYTEAIASGLYAALNAYANLINHEAFILPPVTAFGSLIEYATNPDTDRYQPMHVNFGIIEPLEQRIKNKQLRYQAYAKRSIESLETVLGSYEALGPFNQLPANLFEDRATECS